MYLVMDERQGVTYLVFTWRDPRQDGYTGQVIEGVSLDYDMDAVHSWSDGQGRPEACVGQAPNNAKQYRVFKYSSERQAAGLQPVAGTPVVFGSWRDYLRARHPDALRDEDWYDFLDELDDAARRRRRQQGTEALVSLLGKSRDEVAEWVAKKHFIVDSSIREVWYLPQGAPLDEIRLLELSDRLAGWEGRAEALDFGLDVDGASFHLLVADVTSEQLDRIRHDPSCLPHGWTLDGHRTWRRGA